MRRGGLRVLAAVGAAVATLPSCSFLPGGGDTYQVTVYFPRAVALYEASNVRVLGLPAGTVSDIETEGNRVRVELSMDESVPVPVEELRAMLVPQSLIGERYVELTPAWTEGKQRLSDLPEDERVIPIEQTVIPVEPDDALAAANEFLRALQPEGGDDPGLGDLIDNVAAALEGNGANLNDAIGNIAQLVDTFAERDDQLAAIVENLDVLTSTLAGREAQIGVVLDAFAQATSVLAAERESIERFVGAVADISEVGADLVIDNAAQLQDDLETLGRLSQSLVANLDAVESLLDTGPVLVSGTDAAFNPELRSVNLRTHLSPLVTELIYDVNALLGNLLPDLGEILPGLCIPVDVACPDGLIGLSGQSTEGSVATDVAAPTPIDTIVALLAAPSAAPAEDDDDSLAGRVAGGAERIGGWFRDGFETLAGAG